MFNNQLENLLHIKNSKNSMPFLDHKKDFESLLFPYQIVLCKC